MHYCAKAGSILFLPLYVYVVTFIYLERLGSRQTLQNSGVLRLSPDNIHRIMTIEFFIDARVLTPSLTYAPLAHYSVVVACGATRILGE